MAESDFVRELLLQRRPYQIDTRRRPAPQQAVAADEQGLALPDPDELILPGADAPSGPKPTIDPARYVLEGMIADEGLVQQNPNMLPGGVRDSMDERMNDTRRSNRDLSAQRQGMASQRRADVGRTPAQSLSDSSRIVDRAKRSRSDASAGDVRLGQKADNIRTGRATRRADEALNRYDADRRAWESQMDAAIETGNVQLQAQLGKTKPQPPSLDIDATGGQTVEQIVVPISATLDAVRRADPAAAAALEQLDAGLDPQGDPLKPGEQPNTDVLDANFSDMPGDQRFQAMLETGRRLAATRGNGQMEVVGLSSGVEGGMGRPGTQLMPPNRTQPRGDYDIKPGKSRGTPRSPMEDIDTGAPRRIPQHVDTFDGAMGPRAAPAPSTDVILEGINIDAPEHTGEQKERILFAAHQMGLNLAEFDTSPRGQAMALHEAKRMVREHQRRVGPGGTQRVAASDNPDSPYRYQETPEARAQREANDRVRRTYAHIGSHPLPEGANSADHEELLALAASTDPEDLKRYQEMRRKLRGQEIMGQRQMGVQRRAMTAATHQMTDPRIAPGVFATAMRDAEGDPQAQASVLMQYGLFDQANAVLGLDAQAAGIADAREARDSELEIKRFAAENPEGKQPEGDRDTSINDKVDSLVVGVKSGESGGLLSAATSAMGAGSPANLAKPEVRGRILRSAKKHQLPLNHPELIPVLEEEWRHGTFSNYLNAPSYVDQFIENVSRMSGYSEDEVRNWARTNQKLLVGGPFGGQYPVR